MTDWTPITNRGSANDTTNCTECGLPLTDREIELNKTIELPDGPICARCAERIVREFIDAVESMDDTFNDLTKK